MPDLGDIQKIGLYQLPPKGDDFKLPLPLTPPLLPPFYPTPVIPVDQKTIEKALRKGHEIIKDIFDRVIKRPYRYFVEGAAIVGSSAVSPVAGLIVSGTVAVMEGGGLLNKISNDK